MSNFSTEDIAVKNCLCVWHNIKRLNQEQITNFGAEAFSTEESLPDKRTQGKYYQKNMELFNDICQ